MRGNVPFGCGQCLPCRVNQRRIWTWRMYLESLVHQSSSFVTLTYSPEKLPAGGSLCLDHVRGFLKRLRERLRTGYGVSFKFFACGEYGDLSWRPHYHLALFGVDAALSEVVAASWKMGHVAVFEFNEVTAQYIAGYVVKKLTFRGHPMWAQLTPEFSRQSNRPGIGAAAASVVAEQLFFGHGYEDFQKVGDVPYQLRLGNRSVPLGRYLRCKLREAIGMPDDVRQRLIDAFTMEKSREVLALLLGQEGSRTSAQDAIVVSTLGKIRQIEARYKIGHSRGRTL